ncbi:MAG TPA: UvrD-helicase domain-containing protein [Polyangiaceae bacterium]|nr:UvrD-helicase domain-containing protein [Polyangiaceae bacterium]
MRYAPGVPMALNPEQQQAVEHGPGPMLVLAGAGSGKTTVITQRIARLIERGTPPRAILAMTFTNKAANEMLERIVRLAGHRAAEATIGTFHAFGLKFLRIESKALGIPDGRFAIFDQADQAGVVREILRTVRGAADRRYDVWAILARISKARNEFVVPDAYEPRLGDEYGEVTKIVYPRYMKALRAFRAFDFDDLVCETVTLLESRDDVRERWQERYRYVLVDEYQDTNHAQLRLVRLLGGGHSNVCVVGDDDQAIYGWRGADVANILEFDQHFAGTRVVKLERNYRSCRAVLEVANGVIQASEGKRHDKRLVATRPDGQKVQMVVGENGEAEAQFIGNESRRLLDEGLKPRDIAVLFRSATQAEAIETAFKGQQIPYRLVGGTQFYEKKEVKDLIAYLRAALNPRDDISLRRIINYPARGIGDVAVERLAQHALANSKPLSWAVERAPTIPGLSPHAANGCKALHAVIEIASRRFAASESPCSIAKGIVSGVRLETDIAAGSGSNAVAARRKGNLDAFLAMLERNDDKLRGVDALGGFLQMMTLQSETDSDDPGNVATLTTIHGSKGLEFDTVFVAGLEEGLLPHARTLDAKASDVEPQDLGEERRLFYVAVTRAMNRLYLCRARTRQARGGPKGAARTPSRFLADVPPEWIESRAVTGFQPASMKSMLDGLAGVLAAIEKA